MAEARFQGLLVFCGDVDASARFYEGMLGFRRDGDAGPDVNLIVPVAGSGDATVTILLHPGSEPASTPHGIGTFQVEDVDGLVERVRAAGYGIQREPTDEPWGVRAASVIDPDGHVVDLVQPLA